MKNLSFESKIAQAMPELAQERITAAPHSFPPDFEAQLLQKAGADAAEAAGISAGKTAPRRTRSRDILPPKLLAWGGLAAGILVALTAGIILHPDRSETEQSAVIPIEAAEQESGPAAVSVTTAAETTACTTDAQAAASDERAVQTVTAAAAGTVPGKETAKAASATTAAPVSLTAEQAAETEPHETAPQEIIGDLDLDGRITLADRAWAELLHAVGSNPRIGHYSEIVPLSAEQLRQCELIPYEVLKDTDWGRQFYDPAVDYDSITPLHEEEVNAVLRTTELIFRYGLSRDLTVKDYLENKDYYDSYIAEQQAAREEPGIDWTLFGMPAHPTEEDYRAVFDYTYAYTHTENLDSLTDSEKEALRKSLKKKCADALLQLREMRQALNAPQERERTPDEERWLNLLSEIEIYRHIGEEQATVYDLREESRRITDAEEFRRLYDETVRKANAEGDNWVILINGEPPRSVPTMSAEALFAELEAAKNWDFPNP